MFSEELYTECLKTVRIVDEVLKLKPVCLDDLQRIYRKRRYEDTDIGMRRTMDLTTKRKLRISRKSRRRRSKSFVRHVGM